MLQFKTTTNSGIGIALLVQMRNMKKAVLHFAVFLFLVTKT